ncbi:hypothetical protein NM208_g4134 [Fusarium decemcellulare]|uniref:Uncharacterized protein n=2 Tax=Fusarium decemcellulare TaxID=57161 RepID=A0ACC1SLP8_9HYPO|nr:hypothetical protein NM208_g4696 [Fusarium decemcellulare]KAJ3542391.1 hypothetical protein NM208_g4134 [Fusarium decemcellulare]
MESQSPSLHSKPPSPTLASSPVPEIHLPSEWFPEYSSDHETILVRPFKAPCRICGWDGVPETLLHFNHWASATLGDLRRSNCFSCRFLLIACENVLQRTADKRFASPSNADPVAVGSTEFSFIIRGPTFTPASSKHLPRQRAITMWAGEGIGRLGLYVFVPTNQFQLEPPCGLPTKKILSDPISLVSSASWARERLEACSSDHKLCLSSRNPAFLPTRLVDVRPSDLDGSVKLVEGFNLSGGTQYAALSYVWGEPQLQDGSRTTSSTLQGRLNEIPLSSLPKTLQDAIHFTRQLGLDFLWVDSLCIVQNDNDEWNYEAGRMYDVYKNAFVMLGALWGDDCTSGLFSACAEWETQQIATLRLGENVWPLHVSREHDVIRLNWEYRWSGSTPPLFQRAWCFQERMVPPRCIFFGRSELIFGCHDGVGCECGIGYGPDKPEPLAPENTQLLTASEPGHGLRWLAENPQKAWREVAVAYCGLKLGVESDRLTAIGAVAEQMSYARRKDQYLAGLWSTTLLDDLCWLVPRGNWSSGREWANGETIPSWSWASRAKRIRYQGMGAITFTVEVVEANCKYSKDNRFGLLLESKLVLRGRLMNWWSRESEERTLVERESRRLYAFYGNHGTFIFSKHVFRDAQAWKHIPEGTFLLEMGYYAADELLQVFLVLKCHDEENLIFSREGIINPGATAIDDYKGKDQIRSLSKIFSIHSSIKDCTLI